MLSTKQVCENIVKELASEITKAFMIGDLGNALDWEHRIADIISKKVMVKRDEEQPEKVDYEIAEGWKMTTIENQMVKAIQDLNRRLIKIEETAN